MLAVALVGRVVPEWLSNESRYVERWQQPATGGGAGRQILARNPAGEPGTGDRIEAVHGGTDDLDLGVEPEHRHYRIAEAGTSAKIQPVGGIGGARRQLVRLDGRRLCWGFPRREVLSIDPTHAAAVTDRIEAVYRLVGDL